MFSKAILAATIVGAATAQIPAVAKRDFIQDRQLDGVTIAPSCSSALSAVSTLYDSLPTPPADLASVTLPADPCVTPSFTGTLQSEYVSYTSSALQWYSSNSAQLESFITACSDLVGGAAATGLPVCSSYLTGLTSAVQTTTSARATGYSVSPTLTRATSSGPVSTGAASSTASRSGTSSGAPASTSAPAKGAASRETGFAFAAVAAAGVMGAVAAL
ncbi:hypothetical protein EV127DRAFT_101519 [Xylaria flabelliformis]|nr:hypothetical protein EV127DRAFT_101519 [Xylaria flabelliformis]